MNGISKYFSCVAVVAAAWISVPAAAQLTLDSFTPGHYIRHVINPQIHDLHYEALPAHSPLGAARETYFGAAPNPYSQTSTLDVGKGRLIVDSGFGAVAAILVGYGFTLSGQQVPLQLDLAGYSGFRLNFAGIATSEALAAVVTVWPHDGGAYDFEVVLPPNGNPFQEDFPFSGFSKPGGLTQADVSNIDYVVVQAQGGGFASFGITSFQAIQ